MREKWRRPDWHALVLRSNIIDRVFNHSMYYPKMGPFSEAAEFDGRIVQIFGADGVPDVLLQQAEGRIISVECSEALARRLTEHLGALPIRILGRARWERTTEGQWRLLGFLATDIQCLRDESLATSIARLRKVMVSKRADVVCDDNTKGLSNYVQSSAVSSED
jgi:hypothetical protein